MSFWTCVNTSSLHSSVECTVSMCRHFIFIYRLLIIRFILCSHVSTLSSSLNIVFMCQNFLVMCQHFSFWIAHCSHVSTLQVTCVNTLILVCLLSKVLTLQSTCVDTLIFRFESLLTVVRCRHFKRDVLTLHSQIQVCLQVSTVMFWNLFILGLDLGHKFSLMVLIVWPWAK